MATIGNLKIKVTAVTKGLQAGLKKAEKSLKKSSRKMRGISQNLAMSVSAPLAAIGGAALKASADLETLETSFGTLTGSTEKAKAIMEDLKDFASRTPFQIQGLAESQKVLMGFGLSIEDSRKQLELLGNASQGSSAKLNGLAVVMGQVKGAGKLDAKDTLQFINQGVPIIQLLSDTLGKSALEIKELTTKGKIGFEQVSAAMQMANEEGGMFYKGMERQSKTLNGVFSTLKDNLTLALAEIGNNISETFDLKGFGDKLIAKIKVITETFKNLSPEQKRTAIRMAAIAAAIPALIGGLGLLAAALSSIMGLFAAVSLPAIAVAAAIAALTAAFLYAYNSSESFRKGIRAIGRALGSFIKDSIEQFKTFASILKKVFTLDFSGAFEEAKVFVERGFNKFGKAVQAGRDSLEEAAPEPLSISSILGFDIETFKKQVEEATGAVDEGTKSLVERIEELTSKYNKATDPLAKKSLASELLALVATRIKNLKAAGKQASKEIIKLRDELLKTTEGLGTGVGGGSSKVKVEGETEKEKEARLAQEEATRQEARNIYFLEKEKRESEEEIQALKERNARNLAKWEKKQENALKTRLNFIKSKLNEIGAIFDSSSTALGTMFNGVAIAIENLPYNKIGDLISDIQAGGTEGFAAIANSIAAIGQVASGVFSGISQMIGQNIEALNAEKEAKLQALDEIGISEESKQRKRAAIAAKYDRKIAAMKSKQARADKAAAIAAAISQTAVAIASVLDKPFLIPVVAALGAAQVATIASQPIPKFANGGIVSGRTLAEVGEYGSASRGNPEVIAPLDKLRSILSDTQGGNVSGEFRLRGDDLVVAVEQANRRSGRFSGRTQF